MLAPGRDAAVSNTGVTPPPHAACPIRVRLPESAAIRTAFVLVLDAATAIYRFALEPSVVLTAAPPLALLSATL